MSNTELSEEKKVELIKYIDDYSKKISKSDIYETLQKLKKKNSSIRKKKNPLSYEKKMVLQSEDLVLLFEKNSVPSEKLDRVVAGLHYYIWADDIIPDYTENGYLDDAFVLSTIHKEVSKYIKKD